MTQINPEADEILPEDLEAAAHYFDQLQGLTAEQAKDNLIVEQIDTIDNLTAKNENLRFRAILGWGAAAFFLGIELIKWVGVNL